MRCRSGTSPGNGGSNPCVGRRPFRRPPRTRAPRLRRAISSTSRRPPRLALPRARGRRLRAARSRRGAERAGVRRLAARARMAPTCAGCRRGAFSRPVRRRVRGGRDVRHCPRRALARPRGGCTHPSSSHRFLRHGLAALLLLFAPPPLFLRFPPSWPCWVMEVVQKLAGLPQKRPFLMEAVQHLDHLHHLGGGVRVLCHFSDRLPAKRGCFCR